jgi:hypothetical protein
MARLKISGSKHCGAAIVVDNSGQLYSFFYYNIERKNIKSMFFNALKIYCESVDRVSNDVISVLHVFS